MRIQRLNSLEVSLAVQVGVTSSANVNLQLGETKEVVEVDRLRPRERRRKCHR
jgi:hypothetical protein